MVEGTGLENRRTGNGIESSNLSLSVGARLEEPGDVRFFFVDKLCAGKIRWDGWPSGLRRTPGKRVYVKAYREFESLSVRVHAPG